MNTPLLAGKQLCQRAHDDGTELLHSTDFDLNNGDRVAISGPSGAGKSVLLRTIALLDLPSSGQIFFQGQPVSLKAQSIGRYRSQVAYIRQQPVLLPGDVRDNLTFPYTLQQYQQQQFNEDFILGALQQLGKNPDFLQRDGTDLSGGEAQLVCLLRVIQLNPTVLLLDEPTASLDETAARQVQQLVCHWQQQNRQNAYIWISHSEQQVSEVADIVWYMQQGRIIHIESSLKREPHEQSSSGQ